MLDELFEGIRLSGEQRASQFGFRQFVHAPIVTPALGQTLSGTIT